MRSGNADWVMLTQQKFATAPLFTGAAAKYLTYVYVRGLLQLLVTIDGTVAQLLLDADELVVLGHTVGTRE